MNVLLTEFDWGMLTGTAIATFGFMFGSMVDRKKRGKR